MPKSRTVPGIGEAQFPDSMSDQEIDAVVLRQSERHFTPMITAAAKELGVDPDLAVRMARRESNFNPQAVSKAGAQGLFQLMPGTAAELGVKDPFNPEENIRGGLSYFKKLLDAQGGDVGRALAAYNWGPGNLARGGMAAAPPETVEYVKALQGGGQATPLAAPTPANAPESPRQPPIGPAIGPALAQGVISGVAANPPAEEPPAAPEAGAGSRFAGGVGQGLYRAGRAFGIPQALHAVAPGVFPSAEEGARRYAESAGGAAGTVGDIAGSVLASVPVLRAGTAMIPQALQAARPYLTSAVLGAGAGAALTPGGLEERGTAAGISGVLGPAFTGAGKFISGPLAESAAGQAFRQATGEVASALTGAAGRLGRYVGTTVRSLPGMGTRGDERLTEAAVSELWKRATPPGMQVAYKGGAIQGAPYRELGQQFDDAYMAVLQNKRMPVDAYDRAQFDDIVNTNLVGDNARSVHRFIQSSLPELRKNNITGEEWKNIQNKVSAKERDFMSGNPSQREIGRTYQALRTYLNNIRNRALSTDEINRLTGIDDAYGYRMLLQGAAAASDYGERALPQMLEKTMRARSTDEALAKQTAQGQDVIGPLTSLTSGGQGGAGYLARRAAYTALPVVLGGIGGGMTGAAVVPGLGYLYGAAAGSGPASRALFGQTGPQQALARLLRRRPGSETATGMVTQAQE